MEKEFEKCITDFIVSRCLTAFIEDNDYQRLQSDECSKEEVLDTALIMGYKKGAADMLNIFLKCSQNV